MYEQYNDPRFSYADDPGKQRLSTFFQSTPALQTQQPVDAVVHQPPPEQVAADTGSLKKKKKKKKAEDAESIGSDTSKTKRKKKRRAASADSDRSFQSDVSSQGFSPTDVSNSSFNQQLDKNGHPIYQNILDLEEVGYSLDADLDPSLAHQHSEAAIGVAPPAGEPVAVAEPQGDSKKKKKKKKERSKSADALETNIDAELGYEQPTIENALPEQYMDSEQPLHEEPKKKKKKKKERSKSADVIETNIDDIGYEQPSTDSVLSEQQVAAEHEPEHGEHKKKKKKKKDAHASGPQLNAVGQENIDPDARFTVQPYESDIAQRLSGYGDDQEIVNDLRSFQTNIDPPNETNVFEADIDATLYDRNAKSAEAPVETDLDSCAHIPAETHADVLDKPAHFETDIDNVPDMDAPVRVETDIDACVPGETNFDSPIPRETNIDFPGETNIDSPVHQEMEIGSVLPHQFETDIDSEMPGIGTHLDPINPSEQIIDSSVHPGETNFDEVIQSDAPKKKKKKAKENKPMDSSFDALAGTEDGNAPPKRKKKRLKEGEADRSIDGSFDGVEDGDRSLKRKKKKKDKGTDGDRSLDRSLDGLEDGGALEKDTSPKKKKKKAKDADKSMDNSFDTLEDGGLVKDRSLKKKKKKRDPSAEKMKEAEVPAEIATAEQNGSELLGERQPPLLHEEPPQQYGTDEISRAAEPSSLQQRSPLTADADENMDVICSEGDTFGSIPDADIPSSGVEIEAQKPKKSKEGKTKKKKHSPKKSASEDAPVLSEPVLVDFDQPVLTTEENAHVTETSLVETPLDSSNMLSEKDVAEFLGETTVEKSSAFIMEEPTQKPKETSVDDVLPQGSKTPEKKKKKKRSSSKKREASETSFGPEEDVINAAVPVVGQEPQDYLAKMDDHSKPSETNVDDLPSETAIDDILITTENTDPTDAKKKKKKSSKKHAHDTSKSSLPDDGMLSQDHNRDTVIQDENVFQVSGTVEPENVESMAVDTPEPKKKKKKSKSSKNSQSSILGSQEDILMGEGTDAVTHDSGHNQSQETFLHDTPIVHAAVSSSNTPEPKKKKKKKSSRSESKSSLRASKENIMSVGEDTSQMQDGAQPPQPDVVFSDQPIDAYEAILAPDTELVSVESEDFRVQNGAVMDEPKTQLVAKDEAKTKKKKPKKSKSKEDLLQMKEEEPVVLQEPSPESKLETMEGVEDTNTLEKKKKKKSSKRLKGSKSSLARSEENLVTVPTDEDTSLQPITIATEDELHMPATVEQDVRDEFHMNHETEVALEAPADGDSTEKPKKKKKKKSSGSKSSLVELDKDASLQQPEAGEMTADQVQATKGQPPAEENVPEHIEAMEGVEDTNTLEKKQKKKKKSSKKLKGSKSSLARSEENLVTVPTDEDTSIQPVTIAIEDELHMPVTVEQDVRDEFHMNHEPDVALEAPADGDSTEKPKKKKKKKSSGSKSSLVELDKDASLQQPEAGEMTVDQAQSH